MENVVIGRPGPLRAAMTEKTVLTTAEFQYLKKNPDLLITLSEEQTATYKGLLAWEKRSANAKRAVATKRGKYKQWPCNRRKS